MDEVSADFRGLRVPPSPFLTPALARQIESGNYERLEIAGALELVRPGDRVLDLGAGLGLTGAAAAALAGAARVVSYEANPALIPHIRALHRLNGLEAACSVRHAVVWPGPDRPATVDFGLAANFLGSSLANAGQNQVEVTTEALDAVLAEIRPDVILMDIEGAELDLLRHADLSGVRGLVVEFHPRRYRQAGIEECKELIRAQGMRQVMRLSTRRVWTCIRRGEPVRPAPAEGVRSP